jgi:hypothetical protein
LIPSKPDEGPPPSPGFQEDQTLNKEVNMKTDTKGCSTTAPGKEQFEEFWSDTVSRPLVQYDYRHTDGKLFSTVRNSLDECRSQRDHWLRRTTE